MSVFKRSAEQYLGVTSDLINTTIDATTVYITGDLTVDGTITSGSTGTDDLNVLGDLTVDGNTILEGTLGVTGSSILSGSVYMASGVTGGFNVNQGGINVYSGVLGVTGQATFYNNVIGKAYLFGISPYIYISYNSTNTLTIGNGSSIIYALATSSYETYDVNGINPSFTGTTSSYIQPTSTALYEISLFGRANDTTDTLGIVPYYYAQDLSPASYIQSSSYPEWIVAVDSNRRPICYSQILLLDSQYRFDLRTDISQLQTQWLNFCIRLISTI